MSDIGMWPKVAVVAGKQSVGMKVMEGIQWAPLSKPERLAFNGTTAAATLLALTKAFGPVPIRLTNDKHLGMLHGMRCAAGEGEMPYRQLYDALQMFGELEITCV